MVTWRRRRQLATRAWVTLKSRIFMDLCKRPPEIAHNFTRRRRAQRFNLLTKLRDPPFLLCREQHGRHLADRGSQDSNFCLADVCGGFVELIFTRLPAKQRAQRSGS